MPHTEEDFSYSVTTSHLLYRCKFWKVLWYHTAM